MNNTETRDRLLDAAERLFSEHGLEGASLRSITAAASANLASIHYYFGSKEALIHEVFARRLGPLNGERLRLLDAAGAEAGNSPRLLEALVEAFISPPLRFRLNPDLGGGDICRLMGRIYFEPPELTMGILEQFDEVVQRFTSALRRALPQLSQRELTWRFFFMIGSMAIMLVGADIIKEKTEGICDPSDVDGTLHRLVPFVSAGIRDAGARPAEKMP